MKRLILLAALASACFGQSVYPPSSGGSGPCTVSGSQMIGYVLTATDTGTACDWEAVGSASVDANTIKNAWYLSDGGTANAVTGTTTTSFPGAYATGQAVIFKANATNTTSTTININSLGNKNLTKSGSTALAAGNKVSGTTYLAVYDGTQFQLVAFTVVSADIPACPTCVTSAASLTSNAIVLGAGSQASAALGSLGTTTTLLHGNAAGSPTFGSVVSADLNITTSTCTNQFLTAIGATGTGTCTTDTLASAQHANQGTTTTVLHGNAAGNPSFGAVDVTADVTGVLPGTNGGSGVNNSTRTMTYAGNVAFTGAFNPTFAIPSSSTWTLPSGGGTLLLNTRSVSTTSPLGGGGALSSDLTLTCTTCLTSASTVFNSVTYPSSGTSGGILGFTGSTTLASSIAGVAGAMMAWGGAGATPTSPLSLLATNQNLFNETWTLYNSTATTGVTTLILRAGAANSASGAATPLLSIRDTSNAQVGFLREDGTFEGRIAGTLDETAAIQQSVGATPGLNLSSSRFVAWTNGSNWFGTFDIGLTRNAAGVLEVNSGTSCSTVANCRDLKWRHSLASGTAPTITSGFGTSPSFVGGDEGGRITVGTGGIATTGLITFGTAYTNAPSCSANEETTAQLVTAAATTTTLTLTSTVAWTAADKITWICKGF